MPRALPVHTGAFLTTNLRKIEGLAAYAEKISINSYFYALIKFHDESLGICQKQGLPS